MIARALIKISFESYLLREKNMKNAAKWKNIIKKENVLFAGNLKTDHKTNVIIRNV